MSYKNLNLVSLLKSPRTSLRRFSYKLGKEVNVRLSTQSIKMVCEEVDRKGRTYIRDGRISRVMKEF